jgi:hypothetical protein
MAAQQQTAIGQGKRIGLSAEFCRTLVILCVPNVLQHSFCVKSSAAGCREVQGNFKFFFKLCACAALSLLRRVSLPSRSGFLCRSFATLNHS